MSYGSVAPVAGVDVPPGSAVAAFVAVNGDTENTNYSISGGVLCYQGIPVPNVIAAKAAVLGDSSLASVITELTELVALLDDYVSNFPTNVALVQAAWAALKQANSAGWLTPSISSAIESHCAANNMPLTSGG